jgi:lipopolysaccharide biosynthesis glycosyltransferase
MEKSQDRLNILKKIEEYERLGYFDRDVEDDPHSELNIIHFKINWKPWHYDGVLYENHFWDYAKQTSFYEEILNKKLTYTDEEKRRDAIAYERLMQMAIDDAKDPNNYKNLVCK